MDYNKIGKFIKELRQDKLLTQKDLALKLNITDKAISKWERGLGCPDVSILEDLSNILDVSILEILKGRKINKEELNTNIVDNYILDTINYSKKEISIKYKNIILNILSTIIIIIISFISILNIYHIIYLNKEYSYNFDTEQIKSININLDKIKENINIIKNTKLRYKDKDLKELITIIETGYNTLKDNTLLKYKEKIKLSINDLYIVDNYKYDESKIYFAYEILRNYESKMKDYLKHYITILMVKGYNGLGLYEEVSSSYKYNINNNYFADNYKISARVYNILYNTEELLILTNNVIEVGELDV